MPVAAVVRRLVVVLVAWGVVPPSLALALNGAEGRTSTPASLASADDVLPRLSLDPRSGEGDPLGDADSPSAVAPAAASSPRPVPSPLPAPAQEWRRLLPAALVAAGVIGGAAYNSFSDHPTGGFHVADEEWFGRGTYVGGADKVSHFVSFEILARELGALYEYLGYAPLQARLAGFAVSFAAGTVIEIADGTNQYGFAYEDLLMDLFGAATAVVVSTLEARDLVGFRWGRVPGPVPPRAVDGMGRDYSYEIYTGDLKLGGLARRLGVGLGPARFLLLSVTYGVKGYPYAEPSARERQLGFEVGLNFDEMLDALSVHRDTWWGLAAHMVLDGFRIPYTAGGFRYDLNHHAWRGPDTGNSCHACR